MDDTKVKEVRTVSIPNGNALTIASLAFLLACLGGFGDALAPLLAVFDDCSDDEITACFSTLALTSALEKPASRKTRLTPGSSRMEMTSCSTQFFSG